MNFKEKLREILTDDELGQVKTAFDIIGDIAILEIDDELAYKERDIASALLASCKNIKTVVKKAGIHSGKYRRQKMEHLAGEEKKLALHKENNTWMYIDVERVYFSPRLSTERKRIMEQVRDGENILVMFSGAGPYTTVLSKNTKARRIVGIEINPVGHKLSVLNAKKNKLKNIDLFKGDVNDVVPWLCKEPLFGIKSNWRSDHLAAKLKVKPKLLEIFIGEGDLEDHLDDIRSALQDLSKKGMKLMLHQPFVYKGNEVLICTDLPDIKKTSKECMDMLERLCTDFGLAGFVMHPYFDVHKMMKKKKAIFRVKQLEAFLTSQKYEHMVLETPASSFFTKPAIVNRIARKYNVKTCIDIAHIYATSRTEEEFYERMAGFPRDAYYHIADAKYSASSRDIGYYEHSFPVGKGKVDFDRIIPQVKMGIAEVLSIDELQPYEMHESFEKIKKISAELLKFDRILMPLPKSAEDFLPTALLAAKKGAIIHFYDFLHEDDFHLAEGKAIKACHKAGFRFRKLGFVRCGQHSPRTHRVCLDFLVE